MWAELDRESLWIVGGQRPPGGKWRVGVTRCPNSDELVAYGSDPSFGGAVAAAMHAWRRTRETPDAEAPPPSAANAPAGARPVDSLSPKSDERAAAPAGAAALWLRVAAFEALGARRYSQVIQLAAVLLAKDREAPR